MTFVHTRTAGKLTSRCLLCGHTIASRDERDVYLGQRGHDAFTCQMRRAERARTRATEAFLAAHPERPEPIPWALKPPNTHCNAGHEYTPENTRINGRGHQVCKTCETLRGRARRERQNNDTAPRVSSTMRTELGVALGTIEASGAAPDLTPKPLLNTPIERSILMQNNSASATPRQNLGGVA